MYPKRFNQDIYIARRSSVKAAWSAPARIDNPFINTAGLETRASLSADGKRLYFGRKLDAQDPGDVFVSTRAKRKDHDGHGWNHPTPVRTSGRTPAPPRYWPQPSRQDPRRDHGPAR